jgi:hypothetical protein
MESKIMQDISLFDWRDNKDAWIKKYIASGIRTGDIDLMIDELGPDIYCFPLFTDAFCYEVVEQAERLSKWTTARHEFYPTTDVLLTDLGLAEMYHQVMLTFCHPVARKLWRLEGRHWEDMVEESFMARYRSNEQVLLSVHQDYADYTFTVGLNSGFEGGGTWFVRQKILGNPKSGYCTLFPCITHPHGGRPTTKGTRYIVVSFCRRRNLYEHS